MKKLILISAILLGILASCKSHKTCPTYMGSFNKSQQTQHQHPW